MQMEVKRILSSRHSQKGIDRSTPNIRFRSRMSRLGVGDAVINGHAMESRAMMNRDLALENMLTKGTSRWPDTMSDVK